MESSSLYDTPHSWLEGMNAVQQHDLAVFARNHLSYLEYASEVAADDSERLVTFRSAKAWTSAARALNEHGSGRVSVFFAVVGEPTVQFKAKLQEVKLRPSEADSASKKLLRLVPPETAAEGLWKDGHGTLYAISSCHRIENPLSLSELTKASDNTPLSADFKYSYALIRNPPPPAILELEPPDTPTIPPQVESPDTPPPPPQVDAYITRIIRDTALVRRLKALHNDTCQICGTRLQLANGRGYSEGHHLRPLGNPHRGPDVAENILIVCPNCHALLDRCSLTLDIPGLSVRAQHEVGLTYLDYHNDLVDSWTQSMT